MNTSETDDEKEADGQISDVLDGAKLWVTLPRPLTKEELEADVELQKIKIETKLQLIESERNYNARAHYDVSLAEAQANQQEAERKSKEKRDEAARRLSIVLVSILGVSILIHYVTVIVFALQGANKVPEILQNVFNAWLPAITGLVSGVVGYYFGNRDK
jgi:cation transport ATPase